MGQYKPHTPAALSSSPMHCLYVNHALAYRIKTWHTDVMLDENQ